MNGHVFAVTATCIESNIVSNQENVRREFQIVFSGYYFFRVTRKSSRVGVSEVNSPKGRGKILTAANYRVSVRNPENVEREIL